MNPAEIVVLLLMVVAALVVAAEKVKLPYPVVLVIAGLALSFASNLPVMRLNPDIVFYFFLPALIYPAALFTSWRDFRRNLRPILFLAVGLVLATMTGVAYVTHTLIPSIPLAAAFALGAIVSPPDAIAAVAVLRRLSVPRRIETILEGESLVNDATALVALQFAVAALTSGHFSLGAAVWNFVLKGAGGVLFGLVVAWLIREIHRHLDDPPIQITISLLTPFAAYLPAERLHLSGVLATVAAGIYLGWHSPTIVSARYRIQAAAFWQMLVFLLNGFVFITIGLQLPGILRELSDGSLGRVVRAAALISIIVIGIRIAWVFCATYLARLTSDRLGQRDSIQWRETALIAWSGMRGVVSLAAAFALPIALPNGTPFPGRSYILFFAFAIILATLVLQGLTLPAVIRALGVRDAGETDEEERAARLAANKAALKFIREICMREAAPDEVLDRLRAEYNDRMQELEACCGATDNPAGEIATPRYQDLQHQALQIERQTIIQLRNEQVINDEALRRIQRDLDLAEARLTGF